MNKRDVEILRSYEKSSIRNLHEAYGRFSNRKAEAWRYCEALCKANDGKELKVLGANTSYFSAGFLFTDEEGNECLMYITHANDRKIILKRKDGNRDGKQ